MHQATALFHFDEYVHMREWPCSDDVSNGIENRHFTILMKRIRFLSRYLNFFNCDDFTMLIKSPFISFSQPEYETVANHFHVGSLRFLLISTAIHPVVAAYVLTVPLSTRSNLSIYWSLLIYTPLLYLSMYCCWWRSYNIY